MGELDGRVAAITGGTQGIGRAIAVAFVREGARVVMNGRSEEKGRKALAEMGAGDAVHFITGDVKKRDDCDRLVETTVDHFGRIDIMVNNAGGGENHAPVAQLTVESMQDTLVWNFWSTFWCTRRALNEMIPQQFGRIININSVEGKVGKPGVASYVAAKHAINGLTKSCAHEVGTMGITVNSICAGAVETEGMREMGSAAAETMGITYQGLLDWFAEEAATKRLIEVEDVAALVVLLASDAGGGITGSMISVDGGTSPY